jgi:hypothetical protein
MTDEPPKPGGGLGFSLAAAPKRKVQVQVAEQREERQLITGIEGTRIKAAEPEGPAAGPRVIAAVANTYRAGVGRGGGAAGRGGFVPSFVPPSNEDALASTNEERFVAAPKGDGAQPAVQKYGLQRMGGRAGAAGEQQREEQQEQQQQQYDEGGGRNGGPAAPAAALPVRGRGGDKDALMQELGELPEEMAPEVGGWGVLLCGPRGRVHGAVVLRQWDGHASAWWLSWLGSTASALPAADLTACSRTSPLGVEWWVRAPSV